MSDQRRRTAANDFTVKEDGEPVDARRRRSPYRRRPRASCWSSTPRGRWRQDGKLDAVKAAIKRLRRPEAAQRPDRHRRLQQQRRGRSRASPPTPTSSRSRSSACEPNNETAMWDGVSIGLRILAQSPADLQANVVLITDGRDTVSSTDFADHAGQRAVGERRRVHHRHRRARARPGAAARTWRPPAAATFADGRRPPSSAGCSQASAPILDNQYELSYTSTAQGPRSSTSSVSAGGLLGRGREHRHRHRHRGRVRPARGGRVEDDRACSTGAAAKWIVALARARGRRPARLRA